MSPEGMKGMDESADLQHGPTGAPILDQFSEEGFVDCVFRLARVSDNGSWRRLHAIADHKGQAVALDLDVLPQYGGGLEPENLDVIAEHVHRPGVIFRRSGPESDRLIDIMASLYGVPSVPRRMVDSFPVTAIALHVDRGERDPVPVKVKLFGNDGEDNPAEDYFECYLNIDFERGLVFWNEKDPDYREALIRCLSRERSGNAQDPAG